MADFTFQLSQGRLVWGTKSYKATSGPYGKGSLPTGKYIVQKRMVTNSPSLAKGFRDPKSGEAWFIPLTPRFSTARTGLGIHPDGNKIGTLGCIGIHPNDAAAFWDRWLQTPMSLRPGQLEVTN